MTYSSQINPVIAATGNIASLSANIMYVGSSTGLISAITTSTTGNTEQVILSVDSTIGYEFIVRGSTATSFDIYMGTVNCATNGAFSVYGVIGTLGTVNVVKNIVTSNIDLSIIPNTDQQCLWVVQYRGI